MWFTHAYHEAWHWFRQRNQNLIYSLSSPWIYYFLSLGAIDWSALLISPWSLWRIFLDCIEWHSFKPHSGVSPLNHILNIYLSLSSSFTDSYYSKLDIGFSSHVLLSMIWKTYIEEHVVSAILLLLLFLLVNIVMDTLHFL